jgi:hypothetical protein
VSSEQDAARWRAARECPKVLQALGTTTPEAAEAILDAMVEHLKSQGEPK